MGQFWDTIWIVRLDYLYTNKLMLLSHFSHVRLGATPQTAAHQAPLSLGFSRQEHWSGLTFPSPMHESEKWKWSRSVVSDSSDPMDCNLLGSSAHGIFQARVLEWGVSCSVVSSSLRPHGLQPSRLLHPWEFPGKSTGVGCHCKVREISLTLDM